MNRALTLKWFAVLGLASLFYLLAPRDVSPQMPLYLGMTSAAVIIWTFDLLPAVAVAAALTFLYLLTNMAPPEVVLGPWTTVLIWTTFGAAIFGEAMEKTGLAKRVALRCMLLTGGTFTGMLIGFAIGGIILGLLLASGFARTVIFCAIAVGIIRALDIDPKSRLSSIIVIACFFAAAAPTMQFLHTSESFIWSFQVLMKAIGGNVDWWEYLNHACFINTIYVALSFLTIYFMRGKVRLPEGGKLKLILEERLAEMGPMTVSEKRLLVLAILGILGFMVEPWTGVNAVYVLCLVALFCYMPGMKIMGALLLQQPEHRVPRLRGGLHGHRFCGGRSRSQQVGRLVHHPVPQGTAPHARRALLLPRGRDYQPAPDPFRGDRGLHPGVRRTRRPDGRQPAALVLRLRVRARSVLLPL